MSTSSTSSGSISGFFLKNLCLIFVVASVIPDYAMYFLTFYNKSDTCPIQFSNFLSLQLRYLVILALMYHDHFRYIITFEEIDSIYCLKSRADSWKLNNRSFVIFSVYSDLKSYSVILFFSFISLDSDFWFTLAFFKILMKKIRNLLRETDYHLVLFVEYV